MRSAPPSTGLRSLTSWTRVMRLEAEASIGLCGRRRRWWLCALVDRRHELSVRQVKAYVKLNCGPPVLRAPVVERRPRDKRYIPDDVHTLRIQANHDTLGSQRHASAFLYHNDPVAEVEFLIHQPVNCVLRFDHCSRWDILHHCASEIGW
jgi:hypothetical protein